MTKGDIVLIPFPFTDLSDYKTRPAMVLVELKHDMIVAFITTQMKYQENYDIPVEPDSQNHLKLPSIIKLTKLATLDRQIILGKLGTFNSIILQEIDRNLTALFQLG